MADKVEIIEGGILHIIVEGEQTGEDVAFASAESDRLLQENDIKEIRYLVDFSEAGRIDPSARQALKDRLKNVEQRGKVKYAIVGLSKTLANLISLYVRAIHTESEYRFFKTKDEALAWLVGMNPNP